MKRLLILLILILLLPPPLQAQDPAPQPYRGCEFSALPAAERAKSSQARHCASMHHYCDVVCAAKRPPPLGCQLVRQRFVEYASLSRLMPGFYTPLDHPPQA